MLICNKTFIYLIIMRRWGDEETHSYPGGYYSSLSSALYHGIHHGRHRANKYEPHIYMMSEGSAGSGNTLCRSLEEAEELYKQVCGKAYEDLELEVAGVE